ncbi:MAG: hypothetical protein EOP06_11855 [Proteobacteria bacterium]|nr:MAG: hypothetical protein EOP06_11855 [Pseudomonadota bacterium]
MIGSESHPETFMQPSRQLREALSWKLVSELHRRHPGKFSAIETHPGGGQYDCLSLWQGNQTIADLNRVGGFHSGQRSIPWNELWQICISDGGIAAVLDRMSDACGFTIPVKLAPTSPETLIYRIMAGVAAALAFEKDVWEWRNGQEDTSGEGDQTYRDQWFEAFLGAKEAARADSSGEPFGNSKYGFWFLLKNHQPRVCISKTALCWASDGGAINLAETYRQDRRPHRLVGIILEKLM